MIVILKQNAEQNEVNALLKHWLPIVIRLSGSSKAAVVSPSATRTNSNPEQLLNTALFNVTNVLGRMTPVRLEQPLKALFPISVTAVFDKSNTPDRYVLSLAACSPIFTRLVACEKSSETTS